MKEYPETHQKGVITLENMPEPLGEHRVIEGDFGIQIATDGKVWICINGVAFIRFRPGIVGVEKPKVPRYDDPGPWGSG